MSDRRTSNDRRGRYGRRRSAVDRVAVIEIAESNLRVVVLDRSPDGSPDLARTESITWRHEATSLNSDLGFEELSTALRDLAEQHDLQNIQLHFVLSGEFCVTKAIRGTVEEVRRELQKLEHRSRLYLMLGPGEKTTVHKIRPLDARHEYAVAAVCNTRILETIHQATLQSGLNIESIEPALVASSRAVGRLKDAPSEPCLLVHLDGSTIELGVCHEGRLLLDYRPGGHADPRHLVELVRTHLSRLQRHVGRQLRETPPSLRRVYLCGEESVVQVAFPAFAQCKQFDVQKILPNQLQASWQFAEGADHGASVPALGALLNIYLPESERDAPNFMDHILAGVREPLRPIVIRCAIPIAATLLIAFGLAFTNFTMQQSVDSLQRQVDGFAASRNLSHDLFKKFGASRAKLTQLASLASKIPSRSAASVATCIGQCMPDDVWLNRISIENMQTIRLSGASYVEAGVFDFVRWLELAPGFDEVVLEGTRPGRLKTRRTTDFDVQLVLGELNDLVTEVASNE